MLSYGINVTVLIALRLFDMWSSRSSSISGQYYEGDEDGQWLWANVHDSVLQRPDNRLTPSVA
jgi:hypothetical protein